MTFSLKTVPGTISRLLTIAGERFEDAMNRHLRKVVRHDLQFDEIWTYVLMKEKQKVRRNITSDRIGDAYCFTAFERDTKSLLTCLPGISADAPKPIL